VSGIIAQNSGRHTGLVKSVSASGVWNLIETLTASSSATLDFTSGIDSTYDEYVFKFIEIHPETDSTDFSFQGNAAGGSGFNETISSTFWIVHHVEDNSAYGISYVAASDQAQGTGFQALCNSVGNDNDAQLSGTLHLFAPSDTTFVKHFISRTQIYAENNASVEANIQGYLNTTTAIDEIQFKMDSGDIDSGTISLYGIS
jgi:hypothetical protein